MGEECWVFDLKDLEIGMKKCCGVGNWVDLEVVDDVVCKLCIFFGIVDYWLIVLDVKIGKKCVDFGDGGQVKMFIDKFEIFIGEVVFNFCLVIVNDVVVVGLVVVDNQWVEVLSGWVLVYDVCIGKLVW